MNITQSNKPNTRFYGNTMEKECSNALLLNPKAVKLRQPVESYKQLGFKFNLVGIAAFAGISPRSAYNQKNDIHNYWFEANMSPSIDMQLIQSKSMKLALTDVQSLEEAFGAILGVYLKTETDVLDGTSSLNKVKELGLQITKIYRLVCNYKNAQGVPVHSGNKSAKYLLTSKITLDKLFERSKDYMPGKFSKRWQATKLLQQYVHVSINKLLDMISNSDSVSGCAYSSCHMFTKEA